MAPLPFVVAQAAWTGMVTNNSRSTENSATSTRDVSKCDGSEDTSKMDCYSIHLGSETNTFKDIHDRITDEGKRWLQQPIETLTTLNYTVQVIGGAPTDQSGYPLYLSMHGGGGPPPDQLPLNEAGATAYKNSKKTNDDAYDQMTRGYTGAITSGVWVSLRGIGDSWDLHFTRAGYVLIERLIENIIMFGVKKDGTTNTSTTVTVNPNKVYLIGFSAGGDAVYRLAVRLAQRFAAVHLGGGDPGSMINNVSNLMNTPICLQVGEQDAGEGGFGRNKNLAECGVNLGKLEANPPASVTATGVPVYVHKVWIHPTAPDKPSKHVTVYDWRHFSGWEGDNFWFNSEQTRPVPTRASSTVISDPSQWSTNFASNANWLNKDPISASESKGPSAGRGMTSTNTNAIDWLNSQPARNPIPLNVVWNLAIVQSNDNFTENVFTNTSGRGADAMGRSQFYWLDVGKHSTTEVGPVIQAGYEKTSRKIVVTKAKTYLRILLRPDMMDITQPVTVVIGNQTIPNIHVNVDNKTVIADTLVRRDPNFVFTADIVLTQAQSGGTWTATSTPLS